MAKTHSQSVIEYNRKRDNLMCRPTKREGELIRAAAKAAGMSVQAYMLEAVREHTERKAPTPPRWIPVGERLPELGVKVLCYCKAFSPPAGREVWTVAELTRRELDVDAPDEAFVGVFWFDSWGLPVDYEVTHWMPRPEKPGMEGQKEES